MDPTHITTILIADDDPSHLLLAEAALGGAGRTSPMLRPFINR